MLAFSSFVHTAPFSSSPPSVLSSPSSQSGAPAVAEGEPTVPEDGEGEKCVCVHCNACVHTHSFICTADVSQSHIRPACFMDWVSDVDNPHPLQLCATPPLSLCRTWPSAHPRGPVPSSQYWWCCSDQEPGRSDR